jgi:hypothetical protein
LPKAKYDYIIEIDGDIIIQRFCKRSFNFAEKGIYLFVQGKYSKDILKLFLIRK